MKKINELEYEFENMVERILWMFDAPVIEGVTWEEVNVGGGSRPLRRGG